MSAPTDGLRVGFIGCGGVAQNHFSGISTFEDVEMAAFCDLDSDRAESTAAKYGGAAYTSAERLFEERGGELDAVYIILPPFAHGAAERAAIERGIPFFVEKPVGNDLGLLREIEQAVRGASLITSVGYMTRYRQSVQEAKRSLRDDPAVMAHGGWIGGAPKGNAAIHSWWVVREKSGGQLVEQTTHTVDLARYLMGEVVEVWAAAARGFVQGVPNYTNDDASLCTARFESGAIASFYSACCADAPGGESRGVHFNVYARRHTLEFSGWDQAVKLYNADGWSREIKGEPDIFKREDRAFVDAVKSGDRSSILCDYADGFRTAQVTLAANTSMETGKPVSL
ncbi:MAG TPA: Gfo/Idh/MocA family oxidoreductase [Armatimonadota bacterium]|nr:Gfo/Idh/MocA family oxidoreductase [Armatimonadota bacterium]